VTKCQLRQTCGNESNGSLDLINKRVMCSGNEARCLRQIGVPPTSLRHAVANGKQHWNLEWNTLIPAWPSDFLIKTAQNSSQKTAQNSSQNSTRFLLSVVISRDRSHAWIQTLDIRTPLSVFRLVVSPVWCIYIHILGKDHELFINHSNLETLALPNHTNYIKCHLPANMNTLQ